MSALIVTDSSPRSITAHAIDNAVIVACASQADLDLFNQGAGLSGAGLVNRLIVRIVSVLVGIVSVIRIGIVIERVPKIPKENKPIVETATVVAIAVATPIAECSGLRHAMSEARPARAEPPRYSAGSWTAVEGPTVEGTAMKTTALEATVALCHRA